jgi:Flp pilus assembly protein TadG
MMKTRTHDNIDGGQAMIELALVLLFLVSLCLGVFDFARAIRTNNTIANMSREGANLASRTSLAQQDIMNTLADTAQLVPNMQLNGTMIITVLNGVTGGDPTIPNQYYWSSNTPNFLSKLGTTANPTTHRLATLNLQTGQTANAVEVFYNYQSLFSSNVAKLSRQFYSMTVL